MAASSSRRWRPLRHAHDHQAQRGVPDQHAGIHCGGGKGVEIVRERGFRERQPWRAGTEILAQQFDFACKRRRHREAAVADDLGRHPLAHLALGLGIDRQREVGMGLDIDEAGRRPRGRRHRSPERPRRKVVPIAAMRPSRIATSAALPAAPVPSSNRPPRMRMSGCMISGRLAQCAGSDHNDAHAITAHHSASIRPQLLSDAQSARSSRKRSHGADDLRARMR